MAEKTRYSDEELEDDDVEESVNGESGDAADIAAETTSEGETAGDVETEGEDAR